MKTVGWVIGDQLERNTWLYRPHLSGGSGLTRFKWMSDYINSRPELGLRYTLYRPWKKLDGLIFQKSMGVDSLEILRRARRRNTLTIFDANVNYYESWGRSYYEGMLPTSKQTNDACAMTEEADALIGDSSYLTILLRKYNQNAQWIPDNVSMSLVPRYRQVSPYQGRRVRLLWSGQALKLFELLVIGDVLKKCADRIELVLITNSLDALDRWRAELRDRFEELMKVVQNKVVRYTSIKDLFELYAQGGIFVSPRFMDNSYNMGHSEWKIALAMACGRMTLCSPVPSYQDVERQAGGAGIRVCATQEEWLEQLSRIIDGNVDIVAEEYGARRAIEENYATEKIAHRHAELLNSMFAGALRQPLGGM